MNQIFKELKAFPFLFVIIAYSVYLLCNGIYFILLWTLLLSAFYIFISIRLFSNRYIARKYVLNEITLLFTLINLLWILSYDPETNNVVQWFLFLFLITLIELLICWAIELIRRSSANEFNNLITTEGYFDPNGQLTGKKYILYFFITIYLFIIFFIGFRINIFSLNVINLKILVRQILAVLVTIILTVALHEKTTFIYYLDKLEKKNKVIIKTYQS